MFRKLVAIAKSKGLDEIFKQAMEETKSELLDLLREQLQSGKSGIGELPRYKNESTAKLKLRKGSKAPYGVMNLYDTGVFQQRLKLILTVRGARIRSTNKKGPILLKEYGVEIFQLNDTNFKYYLNEILQPKLIKISQDELLK